MKGYRIIYEELLLVAHRRLALAPSSPMPSEIEVMEIFGCSRTTARRAYALLHEEGRVETVPGRGRYAVREGRGIQIGKTVRELIADELRRGIASGDLPENEQILPPSSVGRRFGAHRATARSAYELLEGEGLLRLDSRRWYVEDGAYVRANTARRGPAGPLAGP